MIFLYPALTLAVDEKLCLIIVGIYLHGNILAYHLFSPSPMRRDMQRMLLFVPYRAVEIVTVLRQSGKVTDAEV